MHKIFTPQADVEMINVECRQAGIGCVDCKKRLAENMNKNLEPFRARRAEIGQNPNTVWDVLHDGSKRARAIAEETMAGVREAMQLPK
jgi:tryptophanyl-tRNA synthetase